MTLAYDRLSDIQTIPSAAGTLLTHASGKTYLRGITLFNGNTTVERVKLYNVPDAAGAAGVAGAANQFFDYDLQPRETLVFEWRYPITLQDANDTIQGVTTTASKVTVQFHGSAD
jgi:hypothetical protein